MARPADSARQPALLDVGKRTKGPLRVIVNRAFVERWTCIHKLECGHEVTVRGDNQPKERMRCVECGKARQHKQEVRDGSV